MPATDLNKPKKPIAGSDKIASFLCKHQRNGIVAVPGKSILVIKFARVNGAIGAALIAAVNR